MSDLTTKTRSSSSDSEETKTISFIMGEIAVSDFLSVTILWASSGFDSSFASLCTTSPLTSSGFDSSFASFDSSDALEFFTAASSVSSLGDFGEVAGLGDGVDYH